ncbi:hypothetical protein DENIS_2951 [Desulfonema ishimotonii]|uniref:Uncharacterized protein n=2 Tax=Desulfonema ishimotonii TaxID=45657 RepID=A0A401FYE4_9BACT|nr:hypothetical protein DENIS_2951 [Desulfonema ishimotonii]
MAFTLAASLIFPAIYGYVIQSDRFVAQQVTITGAARLSRAEILHLACLDGAVSIPGFNFTLARKRLRAHPWVDDADVSFGLPWEIRVCIREHQPLAVFDLGRRFIVNTRGEVFKAWAPGDPGHLPVVSGLRFSDISLSGAVLYAPPFKAVMNVLQFGRLPESVVPNRLITEIRVDREMGLTLWVASDPGRLRVKKIKLGYRNYSLKYDRLEKILLYLKKRQSVSEVDSIDLKNPDRVVVDPMGTESFAREDKEV